MDAGVGGRAEGEVADAPVPREGGEEGLRGLELVGVGERIERVRAVVFQLAAKLEVEAACFLVGVLRLHEEIAVTVVGVVHISAAAVVGCGGGEPPRVDVLVCAEAGGEEAVVAAGEGGFGGAVAVLTGDDVYCPGEGREAEYAHGCPLQHLDAVNGGEVDGDVEVEVSGLRLGDVYAVEHDDGLVECAAAHGDVGLHAVCAACADVDTGQVVEQFLKVLRGEGADVAAAERGYHAQSVRRDFGGAACGHLHLADFAGEGGGNGVVNGVERLCCREKEGGQQGE